MPARALTEFSHTGFHTHNTHHTNFHARALTGNLGSPGRPPAALGAYFHTSTYQTHTERTQVTQLCTNVHESNTKCT